MEGEFILLAATLCSILFKVLNYPKIKPLLREVTEIGGKVRLHVVYL